MKTMRAVLLRGPGDLVVQEVPMPEARPGQRLVRVAMCGICGSDLRYYAGENPWAKHTLGYETPNPPNMILGHELSGYVDLAANGHEQAVGVLAFRACGVCAECRRGAHQLCANTAHLGHGAGWQGQNAGGMAEFCPVWEEHLYPLEGRIDLEEAIFLDGLAVAVHAVRRAQLSPLSGVVVLGGGPIGLLIAQAARALGSGPVLVTDVYETPIACAEALGLAALQINTEGEEQASEIIARLGEAPLAVFDTTGDLHAQALGLELLGPGGSFILLAGAAEGLTLSPRALAGERRVLSSSNHQYADFALAFALLAQKRVVVKPLITHRFPLAQAALAFHVAANKRQTRALKVVLTIS